MCTIRALLKTDICSRGGHLTFVGLRVRVVMEAHESNTHMSEKDVELLEY